MPNASQLSGLAPVRYRSGSPWNGGANVYTILAANTNFFFVGDVVTTIGSAGGDAAGRPTVTLASAGAAARGVIVGIGMNPGGPYINPNDLSKIYRPSGAQLVDYYALVVDDPDVLFEVQEGGVGAALTTAAVNRNVNLNAGTRAVTGVGLSPMFLDNNTVAGTATLNLKIQSLIQRSDNAFGTYAKWLVSLNNHEFSTGTASS
jgi:hypothetical protein